MALSPIESQAVSEMADLLYDFLPGKAHPYAAQQISFQGVAAKVGLGNFWPGGSKKPAISMLLRETLESRRTHFCNLILEIINTAMVYRGNKGNPITREEVKELNALIAKVKFKIPELWSTEFLDSLPSSQPVKTDKKSPVEVDLPAFRAEFFQITQLAPQARGFAFEKFLQNLFFAYNLSPRGSFKIVGEQIDGSFELDADTYLVEAKWHDSPTPQSDLLVFSSKVESKARWGRGVFISYNGFTSDGLEAFSKGRATNIVGLDGQDLYFILQGEASLAEAIKMKTRRASETGAFFTSVYELTR